MGSQLFKLAHVAELDRKERGPPANGEVLRVHGIEFAVLFDPGEHKQDSVSV